MWLWIGYGVGAPTHGQHCRDGAEAWAEWRVQRGGSLPVYQFEAGRPRTCRGYVEAFSGIPGKLRSCMAIAARSGQIMAS